MESTESNNVREYRLGKGIKGVGIAFIFVGLMFLGLGIFMLLIGLEESEMLFFGLSLFIGVVAFSVMVPAYKHFKEAQKYSKSRDPVITLTDTDITFHTWLFGPLGTYQFENIEKVRTRMGKRLAITRAGGDKYGHHIGFIKTSFLKRAKILKGRTTILQRGVIDPGPMTLKDDIVELWGDKISGHRSADAWEIFSGILDAIPVD